MRHINWNVLGLTRFFEEVGTGFNFQLQAFGHNGITHVPAPGFHYVAQVLITSVNTGCGNRLQLLIDKGTLCKVLLIGHIQTTWCRTTRPAGAGVPVEVQEVKLREVMGTFNLI